MADYTQSSRLTQLPSEMLSFTITRAVALSTPRLGRLSLAGRKDILTPAFIGNTSRGAISHLTPDIQAQHTSIGGVYMAVEDCAHASIPHNLS